MPEIFLSYLGVGAGLLRVLHCDKDKAADLVPVDLAVNALLCTSWDIHNKYNNNVRALQTIPDENPGENQEYNVIDSPPTIYNFVSSPDNIVTWGEFLSLNLKHGKTVIDKFCS